MRKFISVHWGRFIRVLWFSFYLSFLMTTLGVSCNLLVSGSNGWKMPVATEPEQVFFVIGEPTWGAERFPKVDDFINYPLWQPMREGQHFLFLADRIAMSPVWLNKKNLPAPLYGFALLINAPVDKDSLVSVGDLFIWTGVTIFIPVSIFLAPLIIRNMFLFAVWSYKRRKK